jgi:hypothetical protein
VVLILDMAGLFEGRRLGLMPGRSEPAQLRAQ